jgi:transposase
MSLVEFIHLTAYLMLFGTESLHCYLHQYVGGRGGRPRMDDRKAMSAIFYVLPTGCQWNAVPSLGASSTVHDR